MLQNSPGHVSRAMLQPSLDFPATTLVATNLSLTLPLHITDDQIALETTEVVQLELNFVPSPEDRCDNVNIVPNKTASVYIEDDDGEISIGLALYDTHLLVSAPHA